jgi:hypothetical protein
VFVVDFGTWRAKEPLATRLTLVAGGVAYIACAPGGSEPPSAPRPTYAILRDGAPLVPTGISTSEIGTRLFIVYRVSCILIHTRIFKLDTQYTENFERFTLVQTKILISRLTLGHKINILLIYT